MRLPLGAMFALVSACASPPPVKEPPLFLELPAYLEESTIKPSPPVTPPRKDMRIVPAPNDELTLDGFDLGLTEPISFTVGAATLSPGSEVPLEKVAAFMRNHPEVTRIRIEVHTDNRGAEVWNTRLSADRASAIASWLSERGVDCRRLLAVGLGAARPLESNDTERGRLRNRRTVFHIAEVRGRATGPADGSGQVGADPCVR